MRPLLVTKGIDEMEFVLDAIAQNGDSQTLLAGGVPERFLRKLLGHRIVVDDREPARTASKPPRFTPERPQKSISLYLLLAQDCNLGCVYCLNGEQTYRRSEAPRMSREVAFQAVEMCTKRLAPGGRLQIVFFGGEPLLNWPLAKDIIDYVEDTLVQRYPDRHWHFHLTSNLTRLPDDLIPRLKAHNITVLCDVDGPPELHDATRPFKGGGPSCERISTNVRALVAEGLDVALRATVTSVNASRMADIAEYHRELGGSGTAMVAVNAVNSDEAILGNELLPSPDQFAQGLLDILQRGEWPMKKVFPFNQMAGAVRPGRRRTGIACGAPYANTPVVDVNGEIYACIYLVGMSAYRLGSVFDEEHFPDPEVVNRMLETLYVENIETCRDCSYRFVCSGGCPVGHLTVAANPAASKDVRDYQRDVRCKTLTTVVETLLWQTAERVQNERADGGR